LHEQKLFDARESTADDIITWIFSQENYSPVAKIKGEKKYSLVADHLGTPTQGYNEDGDLIWNRESDSCGKKRMLQGEEGFCNLTYQGQDYDKDINLTYNRFRWYNQEEGVYCAQDPIGLEGGLALYGYVHDPNTWVDVFGLHEAIGWLNGETVKNPNSANGYSWHSDKGASKAGFNGYGATGHSEAKMLEYLDNQYKVGELNGSVLEITSMGQMTKGGKSSLSTLPPCNSCEIGLQAFADKHGMTIQYNFEDENGLKQTQSYTGCGGK